MYVIDHGWHTAIALEGDYIIDQLPDHKHLPNTKYLMIGWGDAKYYPAEHAGIWLFLRAAFWPTESALHIVGFDELATHYFPESEIVEIQVTEEGMNQMSRYIAKQFKLNAQGKPAYLTDGLYPNSAFFEAEKRYFFPRTSNKWTARTLRKSGFPITPFYAVTADNVMRQVRSN